MVDIQLILQQQVVMVMVMVTAMAEAVVEMAQINNLIHSRKAAAAANRQTIIRAAQANQAHLVQAAVVAAAAAIHIPRNIIVHIMVQQHHICTRTVYFEWMI